MENNNTDSENEQNQVNTEEVTELSEQDLDQVSGGFGDGGGAGKPGLAKLAFGDGGGAGKPGLTKPVIGNGSL
jgi:hypothetical protein